MKLIKKITPLLIIIISVLVLPRSAYAFGISPANISNEYLKPGAHYETEFFVTRLEDEADQRMEVFVETELGEAEDWFTFEPGRTFEFPVGATFVPFTIVIDVPEGADLKRYTGNIKVKARPTEQAAAGGVAMVKGAYVEVDVLATNATYEDLSVLQVKMPDVEEGDPVRVVMKVQNSGNEPAAPDSVRLDISDLNQNYLQTVKDDTLEAVPAYETKEITAEFDTELDVGSYWAEMQVNYRGEVIKEEATSFSINSVPAEVDQGVEQPTSVSVSDQSNITALMLTVLGALILAMVLGLYFRKSKQSDTDMEKTLADMVKKNKLLTWLLVAVSLFMLVTGFYMFLTFNSGQSDNLVQPVEKPVSDEMSPSEGSDQDNGNGATTGEDMEEEVTGSEDEVMGVSTSAEDDGSGVGSRLRVESPGSEGMYPIFAQPSFDSEIVYEAENGEKFDANFYEDGWYRVVLGDGTSGWLHESDLSAKE